MTEDRRHSLPNPSKVCTERGDWAEPALTPERLVATCSQPVRRRSSSRPASERMDHVTLTLTLDGEPVEIDEGIAPVIEALWARGIRTLSSCEDGGTAGQPSTPAGVAWIAFASRDDARAFARTSHDPASRVLTFTAAEIADAQTQGIDSAVIAGVGFSARLIGEIAMRVNANGLEGKVGRNDPCWCGSSEKFKRCHGSGC